VVDSWEHGNKISGSIKGGEFLGQLSDFQSLKNDSSTWIWFVYLDFMLLYTWACKWLNM
jgi:hypothetical protein